MMEHGNQKRNEKIKTILVVEDDPMGREIFAEILQYEGYAVVQGIDGLSGWQEFQKVKPDLVLLDLKMPRVDGLELLGRIRKEDSSIPVMMITAFGTSEILIEAFKLGANEFLTKPFVLSELRDKTKELLYKSPLELETHRLRNLACALTEENKRLKEKIEQFSEAQKRGMAGKETATFKAILGAVTHSLKGEFLHIGNSIKELRELNSTPPGIQEECEFIERSIANSQILLRRVLEYLDMSKPRIELINALELLRKVELLVKPRLPLSINLKITIDHDMKEQLISVDIEQLMMVLRELIDNAVNVLREKGGTIELKLERRNGEIGISVKDDGPGISVKLRKKLFKKQIPSESGLGLGLFLCNKVVRALGGELKFQTTSGEGTTFTILLPTASEKKEI